MGTIRKGEMKMKSKFMILFASVLAVSTIGLAGCASDGNATSSTDINSAAVSETASEATSLTPTEDAVSSTASDNEHRGEIINGVFTSTDGIYFAYRSRHYYRIYCKRRKHYYYNILRSQ